MILLLYYGLIVTRYNYNYTKVVIMVCYNLEPFKDAHLETSYQLPLATAPNINRSISACRVYNIVTPPLNASNHICVVTQCKQAGSGF